MIQEAVMLVSFCVRHISLMVSLEEYPLSLPLNMERNLSKKKEKDYPLLCNTADEIETLTGNVNNIK